MRINEIQEIDVNDAIEIIDDFDEIEKSVKIDEILIYVVLY